MKKVLSFFKGLILIVGIPLWVSIYGLFVIVKLIISIGEDTKTFIKEFKKSL